MISFLAYAVYDLAVDTGHYQDANDQIMMLKHTFSVRGELNPSDKGFTRATAGRRREEQSGHGTGNQYVQVPAGRDIVDAQVLSRRIAISALFRA